MLEHLREQAATRSWQLHGVDYYPEEPRLGVQYELLDMERVDRITVKLRVHTETPQRRLRRRPIWPTADHQEREVYDMFGVVFDGHPDLRRILMPEDYEGHPQRRDFPIGGEPVLFTHNEAHDPGMVTRVSTPARASDYRRQEESASRSRRSTAARAPRAARPSELLTLNIGPHHPATHGVLRLLVTLEGEVVRDLKPIIGYVHTGIEKTAEDKAYWKVIPVVERMDYLAYYFNAMAFCGAVETLLERRGPQARAVPARHPPRAQPDHVPPRLARDERARPRRDLDVLVLLPRARARSSTCSSMSSGQRMHTRYFQVGGVIEDIPARLRRQGARVRRRDARAASTSTRDLLDQATRSSSSACAARARSTRRRCSTLGVTGPLLRAAGNPWDLRKATPYSSYEDFDFKIPVGTVGDNYDRYAVRLAEIYESVQDHRAGARRACPRARTSPTTARSRCRRATSSRPRWRR